MKDEFGATAEPPRQGVTIAAPRRVVTLDVALYESYLSDSGMTDDQKQAFLETLWSVIVGFVNLGFGIDPVEQAQGENACERNAKVEELGTPSLISSGISKVEETTTPNLQADISTAVRKGRRK